MNSVPKKLIYNMHISSIYYMPYYILEVCNSAICEYMSIYGNICQDMSIYVHICTYMFIYVNIFWTGNAMINHSVYWMHTHSSTHNNQRIYYHIIYATVKCALTI